MRETDVKKARIALPDFSLWEKKNGKGTAKEWIEIQIVFRM